MMRVARDGLYLCTDCLMAAVNGDFSGLAIHYAPEDADKKLDAIEAGLEELGPHLVPDYDSETGSGIYEFMRPLGGCDCCHSGLAGSFHRFATLEPVPEDEQELERRITALVDAEEYYERSTYLECYYPEKDPELTAHILCYYSRERDSAQRVLADLQSEKATP